MNLKAFTSCLMTPIFKYVSRESRVLASSWFEMRNFRLLITVIHKMEVSIIGVSGV